MIVSVYAHEAGHSVAGKYFSPDFKQTIRWSTIWKVPVPTGVWIQYDSTNPYQILIISLTGIVLGMIPILFLIISFPYIEMYDKIIVLVGYLTGCYYDFLSILRIIK